MATSRRKFLKTGTLVALAGGLPLKGTAMSFAGGSSLFNFTSSNPGSLLNMNAFKRCLQTNFLLTSSIKSATVKLVEVGDYRKGISKRSDKECFSLLFTASKGVSLRQDTYAVKHDWLGEFNMLVVPVGGTYYEAVFNRLY
jgi:hypothetical protein